MDIYIFDEINKRAKRTISTIDTAASNKREVVRNSPIRTHREANKIGACRGGNKRAGCVHASVACVHMREPELREVRALI